MKAFTYLTPGDPTEAAQLLRDHGPGARVIAGGQSLLLALKDRSARPPVLVSLRGMPALTGIRVEGGELVIGAATTYATLARAELPGWQSEISAIAGNLADRPVRTMGTIGGALCAADPRYDMLTLVVGLGARLDVLSPDGTRSLPSPALFSPGGGITLAAGEILSAIRFPAVDAFSVVAFEKFRTRTFDAALASVLCAVRSDAEGRLEEVRLTVGAALPAPIVAESASRTLAGAATADVDVAAVARDVVTEVLADSGSGASAQYARELVRALTRRALARALSSAPRS